MSTADASQAKYGIDELQAALDAETQLRLEAEDNLRRTKEGFEEFLLNAAHDLREPLRTVSAYCELLSRKDIERSESELEQFRRYVLEGTRRMQALIADMVEYTTAAPDGRYFLATDMNEVFGEASRYATPQSGHPVVVVTREPLPVVKGDFGKLAKVARHLFDNAVKYCEKEECRIHVSSRRQGDEWLFMVRDDGPGIDEVYHESVFEPFKRLHGRQYAGSGLGLTFCRKVIESHGGRIWIESRPGEGSTFLFTLSVAD
jgi:light-regulated signal transduction histidine kinase (bacteriophytochrome)